VNRLFGSRVSSLVNVYIPLHAHQVCGDFFRLRAFSRFDYTD